MKIFKTFADDKGNFLLIDRGFLSGYELKMGKTILSIDELQELQHFVTEFIDNHFGRSEAEKLPKPVYIASTEVPGQLPLPFVNADTRKNRPPKPRVDDGLLLGIPQ